MVTIGSKPLPDQIEKRKGERNVVQMYFQLNNTLTILFGCRTEDNLGKALRGEKHSVCNYELFDQLFKVSLKL